VLSSGKASLPQTMTRWTVLNHGILRLRWFPHQTVQWILYREEAGTAGRESPLFPISRRISRQVEQVREIETGKEEIGKTRDGGWVLKGDNEKAGFKYICRRGAPSIVGVVVANVLNGTKNVTCLMRRRKKHWLPE